jgi:hypothetical protein
MSAALRAGPPADAGLRSHVSLQAWELFDGVIEFMHRHASLRHAQVPRRIVPGAE